MVSHHGERITKKSSLAAREQQHRDPRASGEQEGATIPASTRSPPLGAQHLPYINAAGSQEQHQHPTANTNQIIYLTRLELQKARKERC